MKIFLNDNDNDNDDFNDAIDIEWFLNKFWIYIIVDFILKQMFDINTSFCEKLNLNTDMRMKVFQHKNCTRYFFLLSCTQYTAHTHTDIKYIE